MPIKKYYRDVELYRETPGSFETPAGWTLEKTFKGLVQAPSDSNTFQNGKDTSAIAGTLFCDISMNSVIQETDKIKDVASGVRYIISGSKSQAVGITGITPSSGQHCEFALDFDNRG